MPTFRNLDNYRAEVTNFLNDLEAIFGTDPVPAAPVEDVTITTDLDGVGTGTDMTATQAAQIEADLAALATAINAIINRLNTLGLVDPDV